MKCSENMYWKFEKQTVIKKPGDKIDFIVNYYNY